jgi:hypothetical protein
MNEIPVELRLYRSQLRDAIERDLQRRSSRLHVIRPRSLRLAISTLAVFAATAAVVFGLTLSAASPQSAYAAARKAIAASSAGSIDSGTMTLTFALGDHTIHQTTRWDGNDISTSADHGSLSRFGASQVLLIGGDVYVQQADGTWLHYASESDAGALAAPLQMARVDVAGSSAAQILALVPNLQKTMQPDGSTVYTGTIPASDSTEVTPTDDTATRLGERLQSAGRVRQFRLVIGTDGLVRQMSETADDGSAFWSIQYSQLGSTPPITRPTSFTEATRGTPSSR